MTRPDDVGVLVVGTGQAASQLAISLRKCGYPGPVTLIGEEVHLPYERPPLSKAYLAGDAVGEDLVLRPQTFWDTKGVKIISGTRVTRIDRQAAAVELCDGRRLGFEHLVLATGAVPRRPRVGGADLPGVHVLRSRDDADLLRGAMDRADTLVVVGAGFIGLEVAAVARKKGLHVSVLEVSDRAMARVVSARTSAAFVAEHCRRGVDVRLSTGLREIVADRHGVAHAVLTTSQELLSCDFVVLGAGVAPAVELATDAGLECGDGVVVDDHLRTSDPRISAIGDCARFPSPHRSGVHIRLEAVQNAVDQARCVADGLTGTPRAYTAVPWFWTHQYDMKLQVAGLVGDPDEIVVRGQVEEGSFSVFCFSDGRLAGVESVNRPGDHVVARALLGSAHQVTPELVADPDCDLRKHVPRG